MNYPKVVVDTNKILAATIKPGRVRTLLYQAPITPIAPTQVLKEVEEHSQEISRKVGMRREEFLTLFEKLIEDTITLTTISKPYIEKAKRMASTFDPDDWPFIALALQYNAPIWTNDIELIKHSLEVEIYKVVDTKALEMLLEGRNWRETKQYLRTKYTTKI